MYGPISQSAVIKKVSADLYSDTGSNSPRVERVTVQPNPTFTNTLALNNGTLNNGAMARAIVERVCSLRSVVVVQDARVG